MTASNTNSYTARLLHMFNAEALGDGNVDAGANVLAAMALTIANLQRPGSTVVNEEGYRTNLGGSMVVSGGLSASLVSNLVLARLQARQNNVSANVLYWQEFEKRRWEKLVRNQREVDGEPESEPFPPLSELNSCEALLGEGEHIRRGGKLLMPPPGHGFREICRHPLIYAIAGSPGARRCLVGALECGRWRARETGGDFNFPPEHVDGLPAQP